MGVYVSEVYFKKIIFDKFFIFNLTSKISKEIVPFQHKLKSIFEKYMFEFFIN